MYLLSVSIFSLHIFIHMKILFDLDERLIIALTKTIYLVLYNYFKER